MKTTTIRVAAVTGSTRGIGKAIALALGREGMSVALSGTRGEEDNRALLDEFATTGIRAIYIKCDISSGEDRAAFFEEVDRRFDRLDVMVNNAGVAPENRMDLLETTEESFDRVISANLKGTFFMCQQAARLMLDMQKRGPLGYSPRIINISSISAYTASVSRGEYCVSKAGISMTTRLFAARLAGEGIPVFEVRPGIIDTDMTAGVKEKYEKQIADGLTPIGRMGTPEDVAAAVLAAASGRLDFSAGQVLDADGGFGLRIL